MMQCVCLRALADNHIFVGFQGQSCLALSLGTIMRCARTMAPKKPTQETSPTEPAACEPSPDMPKAKGKAKGKAKAKAAAEALRGESKTPEMKHAKPKTQMAPPSDLQPSPMQATAAAKGDGEAVSTEPKKKEDENRRDCSAHCTTRGRSSCTCRNQC